MKIALAMIVRGVDTEAALLDRCLSTIAPFVDGIFITITHLPGETRDKAVEKIALTYGATVSDFEWCTDFAAARNFNFGQVTKEYDYILWSDADDAWRGLNKLKGILKDHGSID